MLANALQCSSGFLYGSWSEEGGILGLTPEVLVSQTSDEKMETMALAGTTTREDYQRNSEAFIDDPKEHTEHLKVVDDITNQMQKFGLVEVGEMGIKTTPHLVHLHTPISLQVQKNQSLESIVKSLHPTPALGCYPRSESLSVMKEFDKLEPRGIFGAPFGMSFSHKKADFVVAIRSVIWDKETMKVGSGCGVVTASDFEKEWRELKVKRESVKKIFGIQ